MKDNASTRLKKHRNKLKESGLIGRTYYLSEESIANLKKYQLDTGATSTDKALDMALMYLGGLTENSKEMKIVLSAKNTISKYRIWNIERSPNTIKAWKFATMELDELFRQKEIRKESFIMWVISKFKAK
jgi:hypothetical protein